MRKLYTLISLDFQGKPGVPGPTRTYPELFALMGGKVPDLRGRVTWGDSVPGKKIEAGLPNITGMLRFDADNFYTEEGALSAMPTPMPGFARQGGGMMATGVKLDASRSNPCYGNSETVQPPAFTVRYLVRARP